MDNEGLRRGCPPVRPVRWALAPAIWPAPQDVCGSAARRLCKCRNGWTQVGREFLLALSLPVSCHPAMAVKEERPVEQTSGSEDDDLYQRRHCGQYVAQDRHRMHLQNLARRKALERAAAIARAASNPELEAREAGFRTCLNGANRSPSKSRPQPTMEAWRKNTPLERQQRPLRVPGALAVPQPLGDVRRSRTPPELPITTRTAERPRRVRRRWAIGAPVHIRTNEGEVLELYSDHYTYEGVGATLKEEKETPAQTQPVDERSRDDGNA